MVFCLNHCYFGVIAGFFINTEASGFQPRVWTQEDLVRALSEL